MSASQACPPQQRATPDGGRSSSTSYRSLVSQLSAAQKTNKGAPAYSRYVNRPLGKRLAALAQIAGLTPNQVTAVSAAFSLTAISLIALVAPSPVLGGAIATLLALGYAFDAADGQLARLQGSGSRGGEFLDHVVDAVKISCLHAAVLVALFRFVDLPSPVFLLVPLGLQVVAAVWFFAMILVDQMRRAVGTAAARSAPASMARSLAAIPTDYGFLCLTFLLYGLPVAFLTVYTGIFAGSLLILAASLVVWYREVSRSDEAPLLAVTRP